MTEAEVDANWSVPGSSTFGHAVRPAGAEAGMDQVVLEQFAQGMLL